MTRLPLIHSAQELAELVNGLGFLPFFSNEIAGFSIEESTPEELWFLDDVPGPWEWKDEVIRAADCAYGKFYQSRAMYISREWFADVCNYRRDGYDFEGWYQDGHADKKEKRLMDAVNAIGPAQGKVLRAAARFDSDERRGFDGLLARLQMRCFLLIDGIEQQIDRHGRPYGWGVCRYATPEQRFGEEYIAAAYDTPPEEAGERIRAHLRRILPDATERAIGNLLGTRGVSDQWSVK